MTSRGWQLRHGHRGVPPASVASDKGSVVGAGLEEQYRLIATFSQEARYGRTGSAATDHNGVRVAGKLKWDVMDSGRWA